MDNQFKTQSTFTPTSVSDLETEIKPGKIEPAQPVNTKPKSTGATLLKFAGKWVGDDLEECLELVIATRGQVSFRNGSLFE